MSAYVELLRTSGTLHPKTVSVKDLKVLVDYEAALRGAGLISIAALFGATLGE